MPRSTLNKSGMWAKPMQFTMTEDDIAHINALKKFLDLSTNTDVIRVALRRLAESVSMPKPTAKRKT